MAEISGRLDRPSKRNRRRRICAWSILLCLLALCADWNGVTAQENTKSHRLLGNGLPTLSGGQSQMELLRRLQMLSGAAQSSGKTPEDSPLADPEALRRLQEAMQSLQKLNPGPPENNPSNQQSPPSPGDGSSNRNKNSQPPQTSSRPRTDSKSSTPETTPDRSALQRIAEQMGLSLGGPNDRSNDGREAGNDSTTQQPHPNDRPGSRPTPQGRTLQGRTPGSPTGTPNRTPGSRSPDSESGQRINGGDSTNTPQPGDSTSRNGTPGRSSTRPPSPGPGRSATQPNRPSARNPNPRNNAEPMPGRSTNEQTEPPKSSMQALLDWMKKQDQSARSGNRPTDVSRNSPDGSPGARMQTPRNNGQPTQPGTGTGHSPTSPSPGRDNSATGRTGRANEQTPNEPATPGRSWFPGGEIAPPRARQSTTQSGHGSTGLDGTSRSGNAPDNSNRRPNEKSSSQARNDGNSSAKESADSDTEQRSAAEIREERLNAQREERLDEVRSSKKTFRQKLAEIAKLARSESDQSDSSDGDADSGTGDNLQSAFVDALADATKGLAEQVDEIVTDERFSQHQRGRRPSRRERGGTFGQFAGLGDRANRWFVDSIEPAAPSTSTLSSTVPETGTGGSSISPGLLAGLFIVSGLGFWLLQRKRAEAQLQSSELNRVPAPANLKSRQDIVQAFHDLAARSPGVIANWWTHDRAAQALATARPDVDDEVRQLAQLYEQARYLPDESSLTDEQLAAAKAAWLRCRKS